ncbi:MAG: NAD-dependent epimerase/dehydratase family protein [Actinomycetia bacterium]|nr:NAD-dependent epimerase/dehydratase family protein [Actinomycetes bacterium]
MSKHVVIGAGAVGSGVARKLAEAGHEVVMVTRSGSGPDHANINKVAADAADPAKLTAIADGATAIYNCANPPYHKWATDWPPISDSTIGAAEATGARLVIMGNLYGFGRGSSPMAATDALHPTSRKGEVRVHMWNDALEAHEAGRIEATEVRASDFFGPGIGESGVLGDRSVGPALKGKTVRIPGPPDQPHSWSYIGDVATTLFHAGTSDLAPGRAWHVPTLEPMTAQQMMDALCDTADTPRVTVKQIPATVMRGIGMVMPVIRELAEMSYQFEAPFEIDAADTVATFDQKPTPLAEQMAATIADARLSG